MGDHRSDRERPGEREAVLTDLHEASRDLMVAETTAEIGEIAVETARDVLGFPFVVLYLADEGGDLLSVQGTDAAADLLAGEVPEQVRSARDDGSAVVVQEVDSSAGEGRNGDGTGVFGPGRSGCLVPLGDEGVLALGSRDRRPSAPTTEYARLLGSNVEAALNRARRESVLRERERELRESRAKIERLHAASTGITACRDEAELYELAIETAEEVLDFEMSCIMIREGEHLVPRAISSGAPPGGTQRMGVAEGQAGRTYQTGEPQLADDLSEDGDARPVKDAYRSGFSVPVGDYGVFQAVADVPAAFDERDVEFAELLMSHVGETASRIRAERDRRKSEARFREIAENLQSVVWMTDPDRRETLYVSPAFETVWGRSKAAVEADPTALLEWVHEADRDRVRAAFEQRPHEFDLQYRIVRADGEERWVHDRAFPITEDGEVTRVVGITADVTDRKRREEELERYERVFETVQDRVYVLDQAGRFRMVNDPFLAMVGYDRDRVVGEHVSLVLDDETVGRIQRAGADLLDGDEGSVTLEVTVETRDGRRVPCETDVAVLPDEDGGMVGVLRDISDRKRVESQLRHERDRRSVLFESIPDPVVEARAEDGGDPRIHSVNPAFEDVFGVDAAAVEGDPLGDHILPPTADARVGGLWKCFDGETLAQEEVRRRTDDGIGHFLLRGIRFETGESVTSSFGIYTDISEQKRRQRQLQVLNRVLRHNLRNDVNKVIGYADLLAECLDDATDERRAETIRNTAEGIVGLSEKVRQIGSALDEEVERAHPIDVVELLDGLLDPYRRRADVDVRTNLPDRQAVDADARLGIALDNVLSNAVEHSDRATPTVEVAVRSADVDRGEWVDVVVADDGPGIPDTERAVLTEEREITQVEHGSGLGLWLVNWIVTSLGGEVGLDDNDPRGSAITIRLRAADAGNVVPLNGEISDG